MDAVAVNQVDNAAALAESFFLAKAVESHKENYSMISKLIEMIGNMHPELSQTLEKLLNTSTFFLINPLAVHSLFNLIAIELIQTERSDLEIQQALDYKFRILFKPQIATTEQKALFRKWHEKYYEEPALKISNFLKDKFGGIAQFISGMYSGKTTAANETCDNLEAEGFKRITLVPAVMRENHVTVRGKTDEHGEYHQIKATAIAATREEAHKPTEEDPFESFYWEDEVNRIISECDDKTVVHFDEYSFMDKDVVLQILNKLLDAGIRVIVAGLDTSYAGLPLETYEAVKQLVEERMGTSLTCNSFIPDQVNPEDDETSIKIPQGSKTARYYNYGTKEAPLYMLDLGVQPLIVPKGRDTLYVPVRKEDHMLNMLPRETVVNMVSPDDYIEFMQKAALSMVA